MLNTMKSDFEIDSINNSLKLKMILSKLSESEKNLILLKYNMGLSYREIGTLLNIDEGSAKTLCYRGRNKFKKLWKEDKYE